jgi:hypothetical protein
MRTTTPPAGGNHPLDEKEYGTVVFLDLDPHIVARLKELNEQDRATPTVVNNVNGVRRTCPLLSFFFVAKSKK